jgi:disulfide bond formation protein DsbB
MNNFIAQFRIQENNYRLLFISIILFGSVSLLVAYFTEFVLGYKPCPLCLYQRVPYFVIIFISILSIVYKKIYKIGLIILICSIVSSIIISGYHSGVEKKIFHPLETCLKKIPLEKEVDADSYLDFIDSQESVSCTEAPFKILGLSMADYNFLINILVIYIFIMALKKSNHA